MREVNEAVFRYVEDMIRYRIQDKEGQIREQIKERLSNKGCTLWGRAYDLSNDSSLEGAAKFVEEVLLEFGPLCADIGEVHVR